MFKWFLNFCYLVFLVVASPILFYRIIFLGKYREGWGEKWLGRVPILPQREGKTRLWFHAVSVGEINLLIPIMRLIAAEHPDWEPVISATSRTGYELGKKLFPNNVVFYCPLDFSWSVEATLKRIDPSMLVLVELELWPNLIMRAHQKGVRVAIINGRISDNSIGSYRRIKWVTRRVLRCVELVTACDLFAQKAFEELGAPRVIQVGSIKFDGAETNRNNEQTQRLVEAAGFTPEEKVFIAGSTQAPEESMAIATWRSLRQEIPALRLVIVPRHPERFDEVAQLLVESLLPWQRRTALTSENRLKAEEILLVDTIGELRGWWGRADVAFVGGSMGKRGGQNMLEPAALGAAVCFGPNTKNFREIASTLLQSQAACVVHNQEELTDFVRRALTDHPWHQAMTDRAANLIQSQTGAAKETLILLESFFKKSCLPV